MNCNPNVQLYAGDTQIIENDEAETETYSNEESDTASQESAMSGIVWLKKENTNDASQFQDAEEVKLPSFTPNVLRALAEDKYMEVSDQVC